MASCLSPAKLEASPLWQFQLNGVVDTRRIIENGAYVIIKELEFRGLKCAGKKIDHVLFGSEPQDQTAVLQRLAEECKLLSSLHHPCLVQFLGIHFESDSQFPVLVMEHLSTTLSTCLDKCGILPEDATYRILHDVALGLRYLHEHEPPIVHKFLSANTVLLTPSMNAKISDIRLANILNVSPAQMAQKMSAHASATLCYMPPEVLIGSPTYTSKVDSYSFGVMIIHVLCGRWPVPTDRNVFHHDRKNAASDMLAPISEIDRRAEYLRDIDQAHPLMGLISQCLNKTPAQRPSASEILHRIDVATPTSPEVTESLQNLVGRIQSQQSEIEAKQSQIETLTSQSQSRQSEVETLRAEVRRLSLQIPPQMENLDTARMQQSCPRPHPPRQRTPSQPNILHPQAKLQWKQVTSLPLGMNRPQVVVLGDKIYVGGGSTDNRWDSYLIFQYNSAGDEWTSLPPCPVRYFGLGQLSGELLTVGGVKHSSIVFGKISGKVYQYKPASKKWKKTLQPMPTARFCLCVISSQSALTACGGTTGFSNDKPVLCTTVEVYVTETSQWHTTDPLPIPCDTMSSTTISGTTYLLGRFTTDSTPTKAVMYAPVVTLIQKAVSQPQLPTESASSAWNTLADTSLYGSAAVNFGGTLLTVGGRDDKAKSPAIYIYIPATNSWKRLGSGDLPELRYDCSAVDLSANRLLVIGGRDENGKITSSVFLGSLKFGF